MTEEDTMDRAARLADFRVAHEVKLARLQHTADSLRRWGFVIIALLALNWLHDLGATVEMLDWLDGRESGFMSDEFSHDVTVIMPLLLVVIPILWGRRRDKQAKVEQRRVDGDAPPHEGG